MEKRAFTASAHSKPTVRRGGIDGLGSTSTELLLLLLLGVELEGKKEVEGEREDFSGLSASTAIFVAFVVAFVAEIALELEAPADADGDAVLLEGKEEEKPHL